MARLKLCDNVKPDCIKASLLDRDKILFLIDMGDKAPAAKTVALLKGSTTVAEVELLVATDLDRPREDEALPEVLSSSLFSFLLLLIVFSSNEILVFTSVSADDDESDRVVFLGEVVLP